MNVVSVANMDLISDETKQKNANTSLSIGVKYRLWDVICVFNVDSGTKPCFAY